MPKWLPKSIVDAERDRRTLEKPANHIPWFGGGTSLGSEGRATYLVACGDIYWFRLEGILVAGQRSIPSGIAWSARPATRFF